MDCGLPSDTFNVGVIFSDYITQNEIDSEIIDCFSKKNYPMAVWCWDYFKNANKVLKSTCLKSVEVNIGMYAETNKFNLLNNKKENFKIKAVSNKEELKVFGQVLAEVFTDELEKENIINYCNKLALSSFDFYSSMKFYLGYLDGEAVATGSSFITKDSAGIYDIVVLECKRKNGLGSQMFNFILQDIKANFSGMCVLLASENGYNIYKKAGFEPACDVYVYENRHLLKWNKIL